MIDKLISRVIGSYFKAQVWLGERRLKHLIGKLDRLSNR
jgi:hypothetical protein